MHARQETILDPLQTTEERRDGARLVEPARVATLQERVAVLEAENSALRRAREEWKQRALRAEMGG